MQETENNKFSLIDLPGLYEEWQKDENVQVCLDNHRSHSVEVRSHPKDETLNINGTQYLWRNKDNWLNWLNFYFIGYLSYLHLMKPNSTNRKRACISYTSSEHNQHPVQSEQHTLDTSWCSLRQPRPSTWPRPPCRRPVWPTRLRSRRTWVLGARLRSTRSRTPWRRWDRWRGHLRICCRCKCGKLCHSQPEDTMFD